MKKLFHRLVLASLLSISLSTSTCNAFVFGDTNAINDTETTEFNLMVLTGTAVVIIGVTTFLVLNKFFFGPMDKMMDR